jgi:proteasome lid subunit RPN8/RPN11
LESIESHRWYNRAVSLSIPSKEKSDLVEGRIVRITQAVRASIEGHAIASNPSECCGLLSGADGVITDAHPLRNAADKPETRYSAAPEELFTATRRIRESGHKLLGIYHSHPRTPAYPSSSDVEMAFYPDAVYFILSLEPAPDLRAFRIRDSVIETVEVIVAANAGHDASSVVPRLAPVCHDVRDPGAAD